MKSIALVFALVSSLITLPMIASARSIDRTPVVAAVEGYQADITGAYLLADGRLQVIQASGSVETVVLSKTALSYLTELALQVSGAKLRAQITTMTCRMTAPDSLGELSVSGFNHDNRTFDSLRVLVLTNSDCTVARKVKPANISVAQKAVELRAALTGLTMNTVTK